MDEMDEMDEDDDITTCPSTITKMIDMGVMTADILNKVGNDGRTVFMNICANVHNSPDIIIRLINLFGHAINIGHVSSNDDKHGSTALLALAGKCKNKDFERVIIRIINEYGIMSKFDYVQYVMSNKELSLFTCLAYYEYEDAMMLLFERYPKECQMMLFKVYGNQTILYAACNHGMSKCAIKMIDLYGMHCMPFHVRDTSENQITYNALFAAINSHLTDVVIKMVRTFGMQCNPDLTGKYGNIIKLIYDRSIDINILYEVLYAFPHLFNSVDNRSYINKGIDIHLSKYELPVYKRAIYDKCLIKMHLIGARSLDKYVVEALSRNDFAVQETNKLLDDTLYSDSTKWPVSRRNSAMAVFARIDDLRQLVFEYLCCDYTQPWGEPHCKLPSPL